eukprot:scaffold233675_cov23-Tisochrysis_lutea.AAC.1
MAWLRPLSSSNSLRSSLASASAAARRSSAATWASRADAAAASATATDEAAALTGAISEARDAWAVHGAPEAEPLAVVGVSPPSARWLSVAAGASSSQATAAAGAPGGRCTPRRVRDSSRPSPSSSLLSVVPAHPVVGTTSSSISTNSGVAARCVNNGGPRARIASGAATSRGTVGATASTWERAATTSSAARIISARAGGTATSGGSVAVSRISTVTHRHLHARALEPSTALVVRAQCASCPAPLVPRRARCRARRVREPRAAARALTARGASLSRRGGRARRDRRPSSPQAVQPDSRLLRPLRRPARKPPPLAQHGYSAALAPWANQALPLLRQASRLARPHRRRRGRERQPARPAPRPLPLPYPPFPPSPPA